MAKANPKRWFPSPHTATISLRKVDKWAEYGAKNSGRPYFETWEQAHAQATAWADAALARAKRDAEDAKRAIVSAQKRIQKVAALKAPNEEPPQ